MTWVDPDTDLDCMIVRNHLGAWCGYVGVPPGHPLHGKHYDDTPGFDVHGGLTFSDSCHEDGDPATAICHIPEPGRPSEVWWLGFDCLHAWDAAPGMIALEGLIPHNAAIFSSLREQMGQSYKTKEFVTQEVLGLAQQLV